MYAFLCSCRIQLFEIDQSLSLLLSLFNHHVAPNPSYKTPISLHATQNKSHQPKLKSFSDSQTLISFPPPPQPLNQVDHTMGKPLHSPPHNMSLVKDHKHGKRSSYESKAKGVSISASILSILVYILVFYIFNLSPSIVFSSSKFWFFISNTLIIIIAADYGSFSSSCDEVVDPYDVYVAKSRQPMSTLYHQPCYTHTTPIVSSPIHLNNRFNGEERNDEEDDVVEVKNMIFSTLNIEPKEEEVTKEELVVDETWKIPTQDSIWESISKKEDNKAPKEIPSNINIIKHVGKDRKKVKKFRRTVSEKLPDATLVEKHERKNVVHRWESERHEPVDADDDEQELEEEMEMGVDDDQFAAMTNEELNRRVEEFIQKFNKHIRLERNINF